MTRISHLRAGGRLAQLGELVSVVAVACWVEIGLRVTTLPRLARLLGTPLAGDRPGSADQTAGPTPAAGRFVLPPAARRSIRVTRRVMRHWPLGDTCLRQALISGQRLRRWQPSLHVGVAKVGDEVRAHAWLTVGETVIDPMRAAADYFPLVTPQTGAASTGTTPTLTTPTRTTPTGTTP